MRVLVLDGNENQAVAAVRSLARAGHRAIVGSSASWSKAGWSRWCNGRFTYPSPQDDSRRFVDAIAREAAREPGTLVLPMTERTTLPLSLHREQIEDAEGRLVLPPHAVVMRAFDKHETTRLAASLGIDVPRTVPVASLADLREQTGSLRYPVVLKPQSSEEYGPGGAVRATGAPLYARNLEELIAAWDAMSQRCGTALIQEFVAGTGVGYFALMQEGTVRAEFAHRRVRDVRPTGSGSALRVSAPADGPIGDHGRRILEALRWHGPAMVEFRQRADGTLTFLEVNGRFWNSLALAVYAGVDFPALTAALAETGHVSPRRGYRAGVRCRWLLGDLRHLIEVWRGAPPSFPGRFPDRWSTLAAVMAPVSGTYHDNFELADPLPELGDWIDFVLRRVPHRARVWRSPELLHADRHASRP